MNRKRMSVIVTLSIALATTLSIVSAPLTSAATKPKAAGRTSTTIPNTILNGKGAPLSKIGIDGDFYIDTRSLLIYGPKKSGKWPLPQNLQGPVGANGVDGKNGSEGKTIATASNVAGPTGAQGLQGLQGEKGEKGDAGSPGASGSAGPTGSVGSSGPQGHTGPQGNTGANGQSTSYYRYNARTNIQSGDPGNTNVIWNNVTQINATQINISHINQDNIDIDIFLALIQTGNILILQDANNSLNYQQFLVTGTITIITNDYVEVPVSLTISGGQGTTNFNNGHNLILGLITQGAAGPQGITGPQGLTGPVEPITLNEFYTNKFNLGTDGIIIIDTNTKTKKQTSVQLLTPNSYSLTNIEKSLNPNISKKSLLEQLCNIQMQNERENTKNKKDCYKLSNIKLFYNLT